MNEAKVTFDVKALVALKDALQEIKNVQWRVRGDSASYAKNANLFLDLPEKESKEKKGFSFQGKSQIQGSISTSKVDIHFETKVPHAIYDDNLGTPIATRLNAGYQTQKYSQKDWEKVSDTHIDMFSDLAEEVGLELNIDDEFKEGTLLMQQHSNTQSKSFTDTGENINPVEKFERSNFTSLTTTVTFETAKLEAVVAAVDKQLENKLSKVPNEVKIASLKENTQQPSR